LGAGVRDTVRLGFPPETFSRLRRSNLRSTAESQEPDRPTADASPTRAAAAPRDEGGPPAELVDVRRQIENAGSRTALNSRRRTSAPLEIRSRDEFREQIGCLFDQFFGEGGLDAEVVVLETPGRRRLMASGTATA
jgi:hypothetical protein